jgi:hypothetical protein
LTAVSVFFAAPSGPASVQGMISVTDPKIDNNRVANAADGDVIARLAFLGFDVFTQRKSNLKRYDLLAVDDRDVSLKISVKGSRTGGWVLRTSIGTKNEKGNADYHAAINEWEKEQNEPGIVFCFVQYKGVGPDQRPRMYLATPKEVAAHLKAQANGRGYGALFEHHVWTAQSQAGAWFVDKIPEHWRFSSELVEQMVAVVQAEIVKGIDRAA